MPERSIIRSQVRKPDQMIQSIDDAIQDIHERIRALVQSTWGQDDLWNTPLVHGILLRPLASGLAVEPFGHLADDLVSLREGWRTPVVHYDVLPNEVVLEAELPGLNREDIQLEVAPGFLRIEGGHASAARKTDAGASHMERSARRFRSVVSPGADMDPNRVSTRFENGMLEVRVARDSGAGAKRTRLIELR